MNTLVIIIIIIQEIICKLQLVDRPTNITSVYFIVFYHIIMMSKSCNNHLFLFVSVSQSVSQSAIHVSCYDFTFDNDQRVRVIDFVVSFLMQL